MSASRTRMILEISPHIQMAIRLRAIKDDCTTGDVVTKAMEHYFKPDVDEALKYVKEPPHETK